MTTDFRKLAKKKLADQLTAANTVLAYLNEKTSLMMKKSSLRIGSFL